MNVEYFVIAVLVGVPVFLGARVVRQFRWDSEAAGRAAAVRYSESDADSYGNADKLPVSGSHGDGYGNGPAFYLDGYRRAGRRAIRRNYGGPRVGRHASGRDLDFANAQAVGGYDLDGD